MVANEVGARIRLLRERLSLAKVDVARLVGVSDVAVHHWESGAALPKGKNLLRLAGALGCSPGYLLGDSLNRVPLSVTAWDQLPRYGSGLVATHLPVGHAVPGVPVGAVAVILLGADLEGGELVVVDYLPRGTRVIYRLGRSGPNLYLDDVGGRYDTIKVDDDLAIIGVIKRIEFDL